MIVLAYSLRRDDPRIAPRSPMRSGRGGSAVMGQGGASGGPRPPGTTIACTPSLSLFTFGMRQAAQAAGAVLRRPADRSGFSEGGAWAVVEASACVAFQHVERLVPEQTVEGMEMPGRVGHLFRFHSSVDVQAGDLVWMRVGNYPDSYWFVDTEPARTTLFAGVAEAEVLRQLEPEPGAQAATAGMVS